MKQWTAYKFDSCKKQLTSQWIAVFFEVNTAQTNHNTKVRIDVKWVLKTFYYNSYILHVICNFDPFISWLNFLLSPNL